MKDEDKSKEQLISELALLRRRINESELSLSKFKGNNEKYTDMLKAAGALLEIFARKSSREEFYDALVKFIRDISGCRCAGIRIVDSSGYMPYEAYIGFSKEFWKSENWIAIDCGTCACMRVVTGQFDPQDAPVTSKGQSFYCNQLTDFFLGLTPEQQLRFRGKCEETGYKSVAVIPVTHQGNTIGAVHIADEGIGKVPLQTVNLIESIAPLIGMAAERYNLENELRESNYTMDILDRILNNISEAAYIIDPDKYEILYYNKAFSSLYPKSITGGICYKEIYNLDAPCGFCTNEIILKDKEKPYQWEFHNSILNKDFMLTDRTIKWPDGRDVRFEFAVDITSRKKMEEALERRMKFEETVKNISSRFIGEYQFDSAVNDSLSDLVHISMTDRACLFGIDNNDNTVRCTHEWHIAGVASQIGSIEGLPASALPWMMDKLRKGEAIQINDISEMPAEASADKDFFENHNIKALLALPIFTNGIITGFIGFDCAKETKVWESQDLSLLSVVTEIISHAIGHRQDEIALYQSEHKYHSLFSNASSAIIYCQAIMDENGWPADYKVLEANRAFEEITGIKIEMIAGKSRSKMSKLTEHSLREIFDISDEVVVSGRKRKFPKRFKDKWFDFSIFSPQSGYCVIMLTDITEARQLQEELESANWKLIDSVKKLRQTQRQLIQSEKLAAIGQLAAGVAHEINNPLGYIMSDFETLKGYIAKYERLLSRYRTLGSFILLSKAQNQEIQLSLSDILRLEHEVKIDYLMGDTEDLLCDVEDGLNRIHKIVKNLNIPSKADFTNDSEEYNLNEGIRNTLTIASNEIKYCAKVKENLDSIPKIHVNGSQINQVLLNIIINAAQAIKRKKSSEYGLISIATYSDEEFVYCEIEDTGEGIPEENMHKLFEPFFTTKPVGQGTGLGLSISYDIVVNKHKGELTAQSIVGTGTKFTIKLPIENVNN